MEFLTLSVESSEADRRLLPIAIEDGFDHVNRVRSMAMSRLMAFALLLCSGCASMGDDSLLQDGLLGDFRSLFSRGDSSAWAVPATPTPTPGPNAVPYS